MTSDDARALLAAAHPEPGGTWADLGAGSGTFTRALATLLGPEGIVYAVDRELRALHALRAIASLRVGLAQVIPTPGDFTALTLPEPLDGLLLANALHFVPDPGAVLARLTTALLRPRGRMIVIEYDRRPASRWVPHPIDAGRLPALAAAAGLTAPEVVATRPSRYGGVIYVAVMGRVG